MDFVVTSVESPGASVLLQRLRGECFGVLVGSAASIWEPSNIPPGQQVSQALARIILNGIDDPDDLLASLVKSTAFEHLMLGYPRSERLRETIAATIAPAKPNPVHFAIAELLGGVFSAIITTNYDACIERAAENIGNAIHVVVTESDYGEGKSIDLLKLHGCAGRPSTMVVTLTDEASLEHWKRTALSKTLLTGKLLVIGYSGLDFELCPEFVELRLDEVVWVNLTDEVSGNAERVLRSAKTSTLLVGDLRKVLSQLIGRDMVAEPGPVRRAFVDDLTRLLSSHELDVWRLRILNGIGCGLQASKVARRLVEDAGLPMSDRYAALMGYAQAAFHQGLYAVADQIAAEAVGLAVRLGDRPGELRSVLERLQARRAAGRALGVWGGLIKLRRRFRDTRFATDVEYEIRFLEVVVMLNLSYLMEATGINTRPRLKGYVLRRLRNITVSAVSAGRWVDYQQAEQIAARFQIPFNSVYKGPTQPLRSMHGFRQIGYVIGAMMAYRDDATTEVPELNEGIRLLRVARAIGCQPEVWKLTDVLLHHYPSAISRFDIEGAWRAWRECQYTMVVRWLLERRHRELFAAKIV